MLGGRVRICFGCAPYRPSPPERKAAVHRVANLIVWGLLIAWISVDRGGPIAGAVFWFTFALAAPLNTIIHEAGHALAARSVGFDVLSIKIGCGPEILARRIGSVRFGLCRYMPMGGLTCFIMPETTSRWRQGLAFAGGALANLLVVAVLLIPGAILSDPSPPWIRTVIGPVATALALANLSTVVSTLWPRSGGEHDSDGAQILALFRAKRSPKIVEDPRLPLLLATQRLTLAGRFTEAADIFAAKLREWPNDPYLLGMVIHCTSCADGDRAAMTRYADLVALAPAGPPRGSDWHADMTGWLAANIAWSTIKSGPDADLEVVDDQIQTALALLPEAPEVKATFGALQVIRGEPEVGERLLIQALRLTSTPHDRADFSAYVAQARRDQGDLDGATEAERLRDHILATALERPVT